MLEEVVIPSRRNVDGEVYGFVKYSNVCDVCKLLKAVNSVCFENFKIVAKVARLDKAAAGEVEKGLEGVGGAVEVSKELVRVRDGVRRVVGEGKTKLVGGKKGMTEGEVAVLARKGRDSDKGAVKGVIENVVKVKEGEKGEKVVTAKPGKDVLIGAVTVQLRNRKLKGKEILSEKEGNGNGDFWHMKVTGKPSIQKLVRTYNSCEEDIWFYKRILARVER